MTDPVHDLTDLIDDHLARRHPVISPARRWSRALAVDIGNRYHLIPADQCEPVTHDYELPAELVEDAPMVDQIHAYTLRDAVTESVSMGILVITRPERFDMPPLPGDLSNMRRFRLQAIGWLPPTQETPTS